MSDADLKPYSFARERFSHACNELAKTDRAASERLLDAVIALSPLRPEDIPRSCQLLYERLQELIGSSLWAEDVAPGALPAAVRSLPEQRRNIAMDLIAMASETLDKHCGVQPGKSKRASNETQEN
ncbi:MAG: hypothetical protein AAFX56_09200 [Pseudomonadota bacterium]